MDKDGFRQVKQTLVIILLLMGLVGCSNTPTLHSKTASQERPNIDKQALKHVKKFERIWRNKISNKVKVRMKDLKRSNTGGVCNIRKKIIYLNTPNWNRDTEIGNEIVAFHELGHCVLDRGHLYYDVKRWKCAPSIMGWKGVTDECYKKHYNYYINELFTGCRKFRHEGLK